MDRFSSRLDTVEGMISELEDRHEDVVQSTSPRNVPGLRALITMEGERPAEV